jgi:hypothetical protein
MKITAMKITLRDLFWFVLVAAILTAWWIDDRSKDDLEQSLNRARKRINNLEARQELLLELLNNRAYHRTGPLPSSP